MDTPVHVWSNKQPCPCSLTIVDLHYWDLYVRNIALIMLWNAKQQQQNSCTYAY